MIRVRDKVRGNSKRFDWPYKNKINLQGVSETAVQYYSYVQIHCKPLKQVRGQNYET